MRRGRHSVTAWIAWVALAAFAAVCLMPGCGGKYDKPLELDRVIRMGEYSYQDPYRGYEGSASLFVTGGRLYAAYVDTTVPGSPSGEVRAYFSDGDRISVEVVRPFAGLRRPTVVGGGRKSVAVADIADQITVRVYALSGGSPVLSFTDPDWRAITGLAVDDTGNIYVADSAADFVRSYKPNGRPRFAVDLADSGFGIGHVLSPMGIAIDGETLLIAEADVEKAQVQRIEIGRPQTGIPFSATSPYISVFTDAEGSETPLLRPVGVAAGQDGNIIVLDRGLGQIMRFDPEGNSVAVVNSEQSGGPQNVSDAVSVGAYSQKIGGAASVYVLDPIRGLIHRWDPK